MRPIKNLELREHVSIAELEDGKKIYISNNKNELRLAIKECIIHNQNDIKRRSKEEQTINDKEEIKIRENIIITLHKQLEQNIILPRRMGIKQTKKKIPKRKKRGKEAEKKRLAQQRQRRNRRLRGGKPKNSKIQEFKKIKQRYYRPKLVKLRR